MREWLRTYSRRKEIAWRQGWIDAAQVERLAHPMKKNAYGQYLLDIARDRVF